MSHELAIIDSGGANIASLLFAFERLGASAVLTDNAEDIAGATRVVLPGVGAARDAMERLSNAGLVDTIRNLKQPVLGVCLGMQLMVDGSEEEDVECLGIIPGTATKLPSSTSHPVPNMGWCPITARASHPGLEAIADGSYFYFVHSYAVPVGSHTIAVAEHAEPFSAMIAKDNFFAAQFHPERSSDNGAALLRNFLNIPA